MLEATFAFYFELAVNLGLCGVGAFVFIVLEGNRRGVPVGRGVLGPAVRWRIGLRDCGGGVVGCWGWFGV